MSRGVIRSLNLKFYLLWCEKQVGGWIKRVSAKPEKSQQGQGQGQGFFICHMINYTGYNQK